MSRIDDYLLEKEQIINRMYQPLRKLLDQLDDELRAVLDGDELYHVLSDFVHYQRSMKRKKSHNQQIRMILKSYESSAPGLKLINFSMMDSYVAAEFLWPTFQKIVEDALDEQLPVFSLRLVLSGINLNEAPSEFYRYELVDLRAIKKLFDDVYWPPVAFWLQLKGISVPVA